MGERARSPVLQNFSPFFATSPYPACFTKVSPGIILCSLVKFNMCPSMSKAGETCPPDGPGPGSKGKLNGWKGTEAPGFAQFASFPKADVFQEDSRLISMRARALHIAVNGVVL